MRLQINKSFIDMYNSHKITYTVGITMLKVDYRNKMYQTSFKNILKNLTDPKI